MSDIVQELIYGRKRTENNISMLKNSLDRHSRDEPREGVEERKGESSDDDNDEESSTGRPYRFKELTDLQTQLVGVSQSALKSQGAVNIAVQNTQQREIQTLREKLKKSGITAEKIVALSGVVLPLHSATLKAAHARIQALEAVGLLRRNELNAAQTTQANLAGENAKLQHAYNNAQVLGTTQTTHIKELKENIQALEAVGDQRRNELHEAQTAQENLAGENANLKGENAELQHAYKVYETKQTNHIKELDEKIQALKAALEAVGLLRRNELHAAQTAQENLAGENAKLQDACKNAQVSETTQTHNIKKLEENIQALEAALEELKAVGDQRRNELHAAQTAQENLAGENANLKGENAKLQNACKNAQVSETKQTNHIKKLEEIIQALEAVGGQRQNELKAAQTAQKNLAGKNANLSGENAKLQDACKNAQVSETTQTKNIKKLEENIQALEAVGDQRQIELNAAQTAQANLLEQNAELPNDTQHLHQLLLVLMQMQVLQRERRIGDTILAFKENELQEHYMKKSNIDRNLASLEKEVQNIQEKNHNLDAHIASQQEEFKELMASPPTENIKQKITAARNKKVLLNHKKKLKATLASEKEKLKKLLDQAHNLDVDIASREEELQQLMEQNHAHALDSKLAVQLKKLYDLTNFAKNELLDEEGNVALRNFDKNMASYQKELQGLQELQELLHADKEASGQVLLSVNDAADENVIPPLGGGYINFNNLGLMHILQ